jgi:hypothetical protein
MMSLVSTFTTVRFGELDTPAFDFIDGSDVNAVGADDFHVLFDFGHCGISMSGTNALRGQMFIRIEESA